MKVGDIVKLTEDFAWALVRSTLITLLIALIIQCVLSIQNVYPFPLGIFIALAICFVIGMVLIFVAPRFCEKRHKRLWEYRSSGSHSTMINAYGEEYGGTVTYETYYCPICKTERDEIRRVND